MSSTSVHNPFRDASYYQTIHEENTAYQQNNWLVEEIDLLAAFGAGSIVELACGNGRFLERAASRWQHVYGCDWAVSPLLARVLVEHGNVSFFRADLYKGLPPCQAELVVSADFLEHLAPDRLDEVLARIDAMAPKAFHKIACYDDGHSHLSVFEPASWLERLQRIDPAYQLDRVENRFGDPNRQIAVLVKGKPAAATGGSAAAERHFDLGKPLPGRDEVTQYFVDRYESSTLLDVGCGSGPVWPLFAAKRVRVTGIDLVPMALVPASVDGAAVTYIEGDFLQARLPHRYGAVYSSHTIEHAPDTEAFLARFFAALEPGGAFCLIWPPPKPFIVSGHVHIFNLGLMLYNLVRLGVDCREVEMVRCGYCLALMGRYRTFEVPTLTHNEGDIDRLSEFFPFPAFQGFDGDTPPGVVELAVTR